MALSDYLRGDLFKQVTETGQEGSRALFNAYLGNRYKDWGGMMSPQARHMGAQFDPIWSQYLGELLSASPASGLKQYGAPHMPGRGGMATPTSFVDFLQGGQPDSPRPGQWLDQFYSGLPPASRGVFGARFQPVTKRVR